LSGPGLSSEQTPVRPGPGKGKTGSTMGPANRLFSKGGYVRAHPVIVETEEEVI